MQEELKKTPLHSCHVTLGARLVPFAGYEMPVQYTSVITETLATRQSIGLFDVSHMGQFRLTGKEVLKELQTLLTNNLSKIQIGQAQYNLMCNESAGIIDDLIVYHRKENEIFICVNASNRTKDFAWMRSRLPKSILLEDESEATALIAVQGPNAQDLLSRVSDRILANQMKYYWAQDTNIFGLPCYLSRTGYTGEDGFEIYLKNEHAEKVWNNLLEEGKRWKITPCGLGARDTLRTEMGYPLHGHEITEATTPLNAGLNWVVKLDQDFDFCGKKALFSELKTGSKSILKGFTVNDRRIPRPDYRIFSGTKEVGKITSGTHSPHLNKPIALGYVLSQSAPPYTVEIRDTQIPLQITQLPFVKPNVKKK